MAILAALSGAPEGLASPGPTLEVRARATLEDLRSECRGTRCALSGRLRDDLGRPVAGVVVRAERAADAAPGARAVGLGVAAQTGTGRTEGDGRFRVQLDGLSEGRHAWALRFEGTRLLGPAAGRLTGHAGRHPVTLRLDLPAHLEMARPHTLNLSANSPEPIEPSSPLRWRLDQGPWTALALDAQGEARLALPGLVPGQHHLEVQFVGDDQHLAAQLEQRLSVLQPVQVTLEARWHPQGPTISGTIRPASEAASVRLTADDLGLARTLAAADGTFALRLAPDRLAPGSHRIRALVAADEAASLEPAASPEVVLVVPAAPPEPPADWSWIPAPVAVGLAGLGALLRRRRRPRPVRVPPPAPPAPPPSVAPLPSAPPGPGCRVLLIDAATDAPLAGRCAPCAEVGGDPFEAPGDARPVPATGLELTPRPTHLWAEAEGYGPVRVALPAGAALQVRLWPLAATAQRLFEACLERAGLPALRFGRETPREAAAALASRGVPTAEALALGEAVAEACFGPRAPDRAAVARLARQCARCAPVPPAPEPGIHLIAASDFT